MSELFAGQNLVQSDCRSPASPVDLKGKVVAIYFSAHWCPPCRQFTPILAQFYQEVNKKYGAGSFEIVFVSSDRTEDQMEEYMRTAHGNWLALEFGDMFAADLSKKYGVSGIPALIVIQDNGEIIDKDGRSGVMNGVASFEKWQSQWKGDKWTKSGSGHTLGGPAAGQSDAQTEREKRLAALEARMKKQ